MENMKMKSKFPLQGWTGLALVAVFWPLNWLLPGLRTHILFFPLWLGYCLVIDGLVFWRTGTSLLARGWKKYIGLFLASAPVWWLFEWFNLRLQNWVYRGAEFFTPLQFFLLATLSFTTVIPAVLGSAELVASFGFVKKLGRGPVIRPDRATTIGFFAAGWVMIALMLAWPRLFFPFVWLSVYFILEPVNAWLGNRSLADYTRDGNWRPVVTLWLGVLLTAFFWEMWNYYCYPKWIYTIPWGGWFKVFEMPLLGYGGYLPFALELYAIVHLFAGLLGHRRMRYVRLGEDEAD
jgi:hypothetical protein